MKKIKERTIGKSTIKRVLFCLDDDLINVVNKQSNKSRFINNAIRQYIKKSNGKFLKDGIIC